jgi:hypothetical protein
MSLLLTGLTLDAENVDVMSDKSRFQWTEPRLISLQTHLEKSLRKYDDA